MGLRKKKEGFDPYEDTEEEFAEKIVGEKEDENIGRVWIWTAIGTSSRLIISHWIGGRKLIDAYHIVGDVASRLLVKPLFVSDELAHYANALSSTYHSEVPVEPTGKPGRPRKPHIVIDSDLDYATVHKVREGGKITKIYRKVVFGDIDRVNERLKDSPSHTINTSYIERSNFDWRLWDAHLVRKGMTYAKAINYLRAKITICIAAYNFIRPHSSLSYHEDANSGKKIYIPTTPAMASGITDHPWTYLELLGV